MERVYLGINIPNIVSVGIIAAVLWAIVMGVKLITKSAPPAASA